MAKIFKKIHNPYVLCAVTHSLTLKPIFRAYIPPGLRWGSRWQLRPTEVKCTCNANGSTHILNGFLINMRYIWGPDS